VLREESNIDRDKSKIEVDLSKKLIINHPSKERESIEKPTEDSKDNSYSENIVEMCHNIVSVVKSNINRGVRKYNTGKTTKSKKENETFNSKHRHSRRLIIPPVNCR
jgi:hypothetical protein